MLSCVRRFSRVRSFRPWQAFRMSSTTPTTTGNPKKGSHAYEYDYIVLGAGSGGVASARRAGQHGAKVLLIEGSSRLGGTCVNVGCIPKKLMHYAGEFGELYKVAQSYGWRHFGEGSYDREQDFAQWKVDWTALQDASRTEIKRLNGVYDRLCAGSNVEVLKDTFGTLTGPHTVQLTDAKSQQVLSEHTSQNILVAVGGKPFVPQLKWVDAHGKDTTSPDQKDLNKVILTSDDMFSMRKLPVGAEHVLDSATTTKEQAYFVIVGGGYIACEFASILSSFGVKVVMLVRKNEVLTGFDSGLRSRLTAALRHKGVHVLTSTTISSATWNGSEEGKSGVASANLHLSFDSNPEYCKDGCCDAWKAFLAENKVACHDDKDKVTTFSLNTPAILMATGRHSRGNLANVFADPMATDSGSEWYADLLSANGRSLLVNHFSQCVGGAKSLSSDKTVPDDTVPFGHIFSVGDCTSRVALTPAAVAEGRAVAETLFNDNPTCVHYAGTNLPESVHNARTFQCQSKEDTDSTDPDTDCPNRACKVVPSAVFSSPECGSVGLTEQAARQQFSEEQLSVYTTGFSPMKFSLLKHLPEGQDDPTSIATGNKVYMKMITAKIPSGVKTEGKEGQGCGSEKEVVVGVHMMGPDSAEIIQVAGIAVNAGLTKKQFNQTLALHPSTAEELVLM